MGIPYCRFCINDFFSNSSGICIYGINLRISLRCSNRRGGITIIKYFIIDPSLPLSKTFKAIKFYKPDFICYRNKLNPSKKEIIKFANFAKNYSKVFINYDSLTDKKLLKYFDGIHFPGSYIDIDLKKFKNKITLFSSHSFEEIKKAKKFDFVTFSPVFDSKGRKGIGIKKLNRACKLHKSIIALGGIIDNMEVKEIKKSKAVGFASIRYFYK